MAFVAWQAYRRRSLALALIAIGFAVPVAALGAHRPGGLPVPLLHEPAVPGPRPRLLPGRAVARRVARTWLLARLAAAVGDHRARPLLWVFKGPLCAVRRGGGGQTPARRRARPAIPSFVLTARTAGARGRRSAWALLLLVRATRRGSGDADADGDGLDRSAPALARAIGRRCVVGRARSLASQLPDTPILTLTSIPVEPIALVVGHAARLWRAASSRRRATPRRFVGGRRAAVVAWFVVLYPNIAALPLPSALVNAYQGLLPTYLYSVPVPGQHGRPRHADRAGPLSPAGDSLTLAWS